MSKKFKIIANGVDIYNTMVPLSDATLKLEVNSAGSLEFVLPPTHISYNDINVLKTTIDVYELQGTTIDDEPIYSWIFRCRPLTITTDFYNRKKVYCEGALAFLNDSIQRPHEYEQISPSGFFNAILTNHNSQVEEDRKIYPGVVDIPIVEIYRNVSYENTFTTLTDMCLGTQGGYFILRIDENDDNKLKLDWKTDLNDSINQPVQFGLNLTEISKELSGEDLYSAIIPLGETDEETGLPVTIVGANEGAQTEDYLLIDDRYSEQGGVDLYGLIFKTITFEGATNPDMLYLMATTWLDNQDFANDFSIECSAADLQGIDIGGITNYAPFKVGTRVRVMSTYHGINKVFPILKMEINLSEAQKSITIGTPKVQTLTEITKPETKKYVGI